MSFLRNIFPKVKAEEEDLVDPQEVLRNKCRESEKVAKLMEIYNTCNDRVNSRTKTAETCTEELFDMLHALDACVTKDLFKQLK